MKNTAQVVALIVLLGVPLAGVSAREQYSWKAYFGAQNKQTSWASITRGVGRGKTGTNLMHDMQNWPVVSAEKLSVLIDELAGAHSDRLIVPVGGLMSARKLNEFVGFMAMIEADGAAAWKQLVYEQALQTGLRTNKHIAWQVGNEINSIAYSEAMTNWLNLPGVPNFDDHRTIAPFVEYYLAPTIEALQEAKNELANQNVGMTVVLGPIAGGWRTSSQAWLEALLSYRVQGQFSAELSNVKVSMRIDKLAQHYFLSKGNSSWHRRLNVAWGRQIEGTPITGFWHTEELGKRRARRGLGSTTALKVFSRCLRWSLGRNLTPDEFLCNFWGWQIDDGNNNSADVAMSTLSELLPDVPLGNVSEATQIIGGSLNLESASFYAHQDGTQLLTMYSDRDTSWLMPSRVRFGPVSLGEVSTTIVVFTAEGVEPFEGEAKWLAAENLYDLDLAKLPTSLTGAVVIAIKPKD